MDLEARQLSLVFEGHLGSFQLMKLAGLDLGVGGMGGREGRGETGGIRR